MIELFDFKSMLSGHEIKWFIGDANSIQRIKDSNFYWEAWGSFNGKPYQLFAWCRRVRVYEKRNLFHRIFWCKSKYAITGERFFLKEISVLDNLNSAYYDYSNIQKLKELTA